MKPNYNILFVFLPLIVMLSTSGNKIITTVANPYQTLSKKKNPTILDISGKYECVEIIEMNPSSSKECWKTDVKEPYAQKGSWKIHHPTIIESNGSKITYKSSTEIYIAVRNSSYFELFLECEGTLNGNKAILKGNTISKIYKPKNIKPSIANETNMQIDIEKDGILIVTSHIKTLNSSTGKIVGEQNSKYKLRKIQ